MNELPNTSPTSDERGRVPASDVPPEGESAFAGVRRGERQAKALWISNLRGGSIGAAIGLLVGIAVGVSVTLLADETLGVRSPALFVVGVAGALMLTGLVLGIAIALARWDGAEQREIDARTGARPPRSEPGSPRR